MKRSYAETVNNAKVMLSGLQSHTETLSKRGIDGEFIKNFENSYHSVMSLDNEQETLKAKLKEKTAALDEEREKLEKMYSEAKKIIKIDIPQESWKEFGIQDKR